MFRNKYVLAAMGAFAASIFATSAMVQAAPSQLTSGSEIDGWRITFPVGTGVSLIADNGSGPVLNLEKIADFTNTSGLLITFTQVNFTSAAASQFAITSESITNSTNQSFSSFNFLLASPLGQGQSFGSEFTQSTFKTTTVGPATSSGQLVTLSDGTIDPGQTAIWSKFNGEGQLLINGKPQTSGTPGDFTLKEIPGTGGPTPSIPLPAAAWTSLSGLVGLGLIASAKKIRRLLA